jgi:hypothetical protein
LSTCEYSKLEEPNVDNVSVDSLISLEEQLETALSVSRARKAELMMEYIESLKEKVSALVFIFDKGHILGYDDS